MLQKRPWLIAVFAALLALLAAGVIISSRERTSTTAAPKPATQAALASTTNPSVLQGLKATVYKSPTCGCCTGYVEFLEKHGVTVNAVDTNDLTQVKADNGIPYSVQSCHTTVIDSYSYVIEGHVPLAALSKLLSERPEVSGIALPGMPTGTPGMAGPQVGALDVVSFEEGSLAPFISL